MDPVWSWCPECGGLLLDPSALDIAAVVAEPSVITELSAAERADVDEAYATEWSTA